jgi:hypothetical protein
VVVTCNSCGTLKQSYSTIKGSQWCFACDRKSGFRELFRTNPPAVEGTMWEKHTHGETPHHSCAACWAEAYNNDYEVLQANLVRLGYYKVRK